MTACILFLLCFIEFVSARAGIGGRIAILRSTSSHGNQLQKLIKNDWDVTHLLVVKKMTLIACWENAHTIKLLEIIAAT